MPIGTSDTQTTGKASAACAIRSLGRPARFLTRSGTAGTIEVVNPAFTRGAFSGVVALTQPAGSHPLAQGIRSVTLTGFARAPTLDRRDGRLVVEAGGVRLSLSGAEARVEGETVRIILPAGRHSPEPR